MATPARWPASVSTSGELVLDSTLTPASATPKPYHTSGGVSASGCEFNGFRGSHPLHGFVHAAHHAFANHYALELTPDDFWSVILQGIGQHVARNPERLRSKLVKHADGRNVINVTRNDMVRGKTTLVEWMGVVAELQEKTMEHVTDTSLVRQMRTEFSTTGELHHLLYRASILSTLQSFMSYRLRTWCGIPKIRLIGTVDDWRKLADNVKQLALSSFDPDLTAWDDVLVTIVDRLAGIRERMDQLAPEAEQREADVRFFRSFYKYESNSGGDLVSGWINGLFPYLGSKGNEFNHHLAGVLSKQVEAPPTSTADQWRWERLGAVHTDAYPSGLTDVPFEWHYLGSVLPMTMYVGFDDPDVSDSCMVRTVMGFAVSHRPHS